jgi:hypothetical protein
MDGKWVAIPELPDIPKGFSTPADYPIRPNQESWWKTAAVYYGLDESIVPTARQFNVLPILKETRFRFRSAPELST